MAIFCSTVVLAVAVHPLAGSVTVTVYAPEVVTEGDAIFEVKLAGPLQL
jgi:hypothetical protein